MKRPTPSDDSPSSRLEALRRLAWFRYRVRCFQRFSERVSRAHGITPQQHQLLLGVAGYTGRGWATISELAEFLQGRHNAVVGLVQRAEERGLVRKVQGEKDRRFVKVHLTRRGFTILDRISRKNITELRALQFEIMKSPQPRPRDIPAAQGT
ncbi:MAG: MarR family transcriptional regulator [Terriglobia bacterium]|jgi:DNA-binding MarR family transcriptional regulator